MENVSGSGSSAPHTNLLSSVQDHSSTDKKQSPEELSISMASKVLASNTTQTPSSKGLTPKRLRKIASAPPGKFQSHRTSASSNNIMGSVKINTNPNETPTSGKSKKASNTYSNIAGYTHKKTEKHSDSEEDEAYNTTEVSKASSPSFPSSPIVNEEKKENANPPEHKRSPSLRLHSPPPQHPPIDHHVPDHANVHFPHEQKNVLIIPLPAFLHENHDRRPEGQQQNSPPTNFTFSTSYSCSSSSAPLQQGYQLRNQEDADHALPSTNKTVFLIGAITVSMIVSNLFMKLLFRDNRNKS